jgi:hypothetical protein
MSAAWKFSTRHFDVRLEIMPDHFTSPIDCFDHDLAREIEEQIESGRLMWFQARAVVRWRGRVIGESILGGCCYESVRDFLDCRYYRDLIAEAINEARATILCAHSINLRAAH